VERGTIYNVAYCLKSAYLVSDGILLVDNQRYVKKNSSIQSNMAQINSSVVEPFYNLLCAGEEKKAKFIGSRVLDAGDIIQTLAGWTVIGYGQVRRPWFSFIFDRKRDFMDKATETQKGVQAMIAAIDDLSLKCNPADAKRALYLLSAPPEEMNMTLVNEISNSVKRIATEAIIRSGDYPRGKRSLDVTLVLSELSSVGKVMDYFTTTIQRLSSYKRRRLGYEPGGLEDAFKDIPSLL